MGDLDSLKDRHVDLPFTPGKHDLRVETGGRLYYVRAVRWGRSLRGDGGSGADGSGWDPTSADDVGAVAAVVVLVALANVPPVRRLLGAAARRVSRPIGAGVARLPWRVGVVHIATDRWGPTGGVRVVRAERHPAGVVPQGRLAELAADVRQGRIAAT